DPGDLEVVSVRAGASPGMHLVGFDAPGETVELRLTARDRSAYAAGILAAADWLARNPRQPGIHPFEPIVDALVARALALMGLIPGDAVRGPLLPLESDAREAMAATLRQLGLIDAGGGRIRAPYGVSDIRDAVA